MPLHIEMVMSIESELLRAAWAKCCLCQKDKKEFSSQQMKILLEQKTMITATWQRLFLFYIINAMPIKSDPTLDECSLIEETLRKNKAQYDKTELRVFI